MTKMIHYMRSTWPHLNVSPRYDSIVPDLPSFSKIIILARERQRDRQREREGERERESE